MKTIAVFHPSSELYGADRIMVIATKALTNYHPVIYLPSRGALIDLIRQELPSAEIKIVPNMPILSRALFNPLGAAKTARNYQTFKTFIKREHQQYNFDQIYVNTLACSILLLALKQLQTPIFTHVHEILEHPRIAAKLTAKLAFTHSNKVISVSNAVQQNLHSLCKKRRGKSIVVHNGIAPIECYDEIKNNRLTFYLFGRIKPEKGQWYLLEALNCISKEELKQTEFHLVGGTLKGKEQLKIALEKKIEIYGLSDVVKLKGFTNDIVAEMSKADVCLIPSLMKDPFPTTVLEAMSAGKAVIATDTGGAKEAIQHNDTGFIIPPNNPTIFAKTIQNLIHNPALIRQIGTNAKVSFGKKFTLKHFNKHWRLTIDAS